MLMTHRPAGSLHLLLIICLCFLTVRPRKKNKQQQSSSRHKSSKSKKKQSASSGQSKPRTGPSSPADIDELVRRQCRLLEMLMSLRHSGFFSESTCDSAAEAGSCLFFFSGLSDALTKSRRVFLSAGASELPVWTEPAGAGVGKVRGDPQETHQVPLQLAFQVGGIKKKKTFPWLFVFTPQSLLTSSCAPPSGSPSLWTRPRTTWTSSPSRWTSRRC